MLIKDSNDIMAEDREADKIKVIENPAKGRVEALRGMRSGKLRRNTYGFAAGRRVEALRPGAAWPVIRDLWRVPICVHRR